MNLWSALAEQSVAIDSSAVPTGSGVGDLISIVIMALIVFGVVGLIVTAIQLLMANSKGEDTTRLKKRLLKFVIPIGGLIILIWVVSFLRGAIGLLR